MASVRTTGVADNSLKSLDFVAWRVMKARKKAHQKDVHRVLSERPRQRRVSDATQH